jgi:hypothetical protein
MGNFGRFFAVKYPSYHYSAAVCLLLAPRRQLFVACFLATFLTKPLTMKSLTLISTIFLASVASA